MAHVISLNLKETAADDDDVDDEEMEAGLRFRALGLCCGHCGAFLSAARGGLLHYLPRRAAPATAAFCSSARFRSVVHFLKLEIPGNTGSITRTCATLAVGLHLVGPLGFKVDDMKLKHLDWITGRILRYVFVEIHDSWDEFQDYIMKQDGEKTVTGIYQKRRKHSFIASGYTTSLGIARQLNSEHINYQPELLEEAQGLFTIPSRGYLCMMTFIWEFFVEDVMGFSCRFNLFIFEDS
ncbi:hypothetical protein GUJ93_ZPchr0010g8293 [Zizania palustris]|uniref:tRNA/rRNA methyltransferase SpoU type domain-containing protein n=1 Tax=Zizania palustris TaxID=103762 RepID=A0A8J5WC15_ZIZPA|nr:hypothetical protein GUJ93_ZPchr0010g8293 [Zizania palustris]